MKAFFTESQKAFFICSLNYFSIKHAAFINKKCFLVMAVHLAPDSLSYYSFLHHHSEWGS